MANMNPAGLFPNMNIDLPAPIAGEMQYRMAQEARQQAAMQSQLGNIERQRQQMLLEQSRANLPLQEAERNLKMQQTQGALQRLPFEQQTSQREAEFRAKPTVMEAVETLEMNNLREKTRAQNMKRQADEMDIFAQAMAPVFERFDAQDPKGMTEAYEEAMATLEKHGVDRKVFKDVDLNRMRMKYDQAVKTAPVLRKQYEQWEAHNRDLELERLKHRNRQSEREADDRKQPANPNAVIARIQNKYRSDPDSVTDSEINLLRESLETTSLKNNEALEDNFWNDAAKQIKAEDEKKGAAVQSNRGTRMRERYNELRKKHFDRVMIESYPELAKRKGVTGAAPANDGGGRVIDFNQLRK